MRQNQWLAGGKRTRSLKPRQRPPQTQTGRKAAGLKLLGVGRVRSLDCPWSSDARFSTPEAPAGPQGDQGAKLPVPRQQLLDGRGVGLGIEIARQLDRAQLGVTILRHLLSSGDCPSDDQPGGRMGIAGVTKIVLCRDEEAVAWAIETNRNYPMAHLWLAAALAHLGRLSEMSEALKTGLALHPSFTIARHRANAWGDNQTYIAQRERLFEGMRKAGVPEG
jgi:hypothetical protein